MQQLRSFATQAQGARAQQAVRPAAPRAALRCRRAAVRVLAHGAVSATELKKQGFIGEMRAVAMKLHTREQAPKEGQQEAKPQPKWQPTREGYVRFLAESQAVYSAFEEIIARAERPEYKAFQNTGLERSAAIAKDLAWFKEKYGIDAPQLPADSPGLAYAKMLQEISVSDPPAFICHYYNYYFAHTAGGRMIGAKVSSMILDGAELEFYKYNGDHAPLLDAVRAKINELAETWTPEQRAHCLHETADTFKSSGALMGFIMGGGH